MARLLCIWRKKMGIVQISQLLNKKCAILHSGRNDSPRGKWAVPSAGGPKGPGKARERCRAPSGKYRADARSAPKTEAIAMVKQVTISNLSDLRKVVAAAGACFEEVGVCDARGAKADAKSILGLMSLDFTRPVQVVCENRRALETVCQALAQ